MSNLTIGKIANNSVTLLLSSKTTSDAPIERHNNDFCDFSLTLPNVVGFPHKSRCICYLQSVTGTISPELSPAPAVIAVRIDGMAPQKVYRNGLEHGYIGAVTVKGSAVSDGDANNDVTMTGDTFTADGDLVSGGVLCQSPFGKQIRVTLFNAVSHEQIVHGTNVFLAGAPVLIKLRLLFLDNEDLKEF